jgi:hypothetical protein
MQIDRHQWFVDEFDRHWAHGFCLTFISGKTAGRVLEIIHSVAAVPVLSEDSNRPHVACVSDVPGGSVMLELAGIAGATQRLAAALSEGDRLTVILVPFSGRRWLAHVRGGTTVSVYDIDDPEIRWGSEPDLLVPQLSEAGLLPVIELDWETDEEEIEFYESQAVPPGTARVLHSIAVAAEITGVELTLQGVSNPQYFMSFADAELIQEKLLSHQR